MLRARVLFGLFTLVAIAALLVPEAKAETPCPVSVNESLGRYTSYNEFDVAKLKLPVDFDLCRVVTDSNSYWPAIQDVAVASPSTAPVKAGEPKQPDSFRTCKDWVSYEKTNGWLAGANLLDPDPTNTYLPNVAVFRIPLTNRYTISFEFNSPLPGRSIRYYKPNFFVANAAEQGRIDRFWSSIREHEEAHAKLNAQVAKSFNLVEVLAFPDSSSASTYASNKAKELAGRYFKSRAAVKDLFHGLTDVWGNAALGLLPGSDNWDWDNLCDSSTSSDFFVAVGPVHVTPGTGCGGWPLGGPAKVLSDVGNFQVFSNGDVKWSLDCSGSSPGVQGGTRTELRNFSCPPIPGVNAPLKAGTGTAVKNTLTGAFTVTCSGFYNLK